VSLHTDPHESARGALDAIETCVAREHWKPIAIQGSLQGGVLLILSLALGLALAQALAIIHVVASTSGLLGGLLALKMERLGDKVVAAGIARRAVASLLLAGVALLLRALAP